ncbi:hypothetical protein Tco_0535872, partial [Tanacetum coccineum]
IKLSVEEPLSARLRGDEDQLSAKHQLAVKGLFECKASESNITYSSQRHSQGSRRLLEYILVNWDGYQLTYSIISGAVPPIPPLLGPSTDSPSIPNANRVDSMPTNDTINTTTTTNVAQSVVDENLPQLLDSRGGSHVTNVHAFDKDDFMTNPLPKRQNQWSNAKRLLANQDKRLKSIIIGCLPNDVMKSVIKYKSAKEMWTELFLAYEGPSNTRDTKIATLRLKFNAFMTLKGEKVNGKYTRDSDVEEDNRTSNEFLADLNVEYQERALLANQKRFYKRSGRDDDYVSSEDEGTTTFKAFMAIAEDEPSVGKGDARPCQ